MTTPAMKLTRNARDILGQMKSDQAVHMLDYFNNPLLEQAIASGQSLRLWGSTDHMAAWMDVSCDNAGTIDVQLWHIASGSPLPQHPYPNDTKIGVPLPTRSNFVASLEFRRMHATLSKLGYATLGAARRSDFALFGDMLKPLAKHIPWVEQITLLAHRVHSSAAGPHLAQALQQMSLIADIMDEDLVRSMSSPCTTAQALLAVHATLHSSRPESSQPGVYALESQDAPTTYLFVQPALYDPKKSLVRQGTHIWLDHTGSPIFLNELKSTADARFANLASHPDPALSSVEWMPMGPTEFGMPLTLTDWNSAMRQGFNASTRQLLDGLAAATPRAMDIQETAILVDAWMESTPSTESLWMDNTSKVHRTTTTFDTSNKSHVSLAMWAHYAANIWADLHPKEHAVLDTLLPKMESLGAIEEWRGQMRAMSGPMQVAAPEMYTLDDAAP